MTTETLTPTDVEGSATERAALFDELSGKRDEGPAAVVDEPLAEEPGATADEPAAASSDQPEPAAAPATAAPAAAKPTDASTKPVEEMSIEELRAHAKKAEADRVKAEHERQAAVGRMAAHQREKDRAERLAKAAQATPAPVPLPQAERLDEAFPDLSAAVKDEVDRRLAGVKEATQQEVAVIKSETLEAVHPGWFDTMKSDGFSYWLSQQPPEVQRKFEGNSVGEYATLLTSFKAATNPSPTTEPAAPSEADRVAAQRQQRVQQQSGLPRGSSSPGSKTTGEPDTPEALFKQLTAQQDLARERASARPR